MLKFLQLSIFTIAFYTNSYCQSEIKINKKDSTYYEVECSFPGGDSYWQNYLQKNLDSEVPIKKGAPSGTYKITVKYFISKNGIIDSVEAQTNSGYGMEAEFIRVLKNSPKWRPASKGGKQTICYRIQSIEFIVP